MIIETVVLIITSCHGGPFDGDAVNRKQSGRSNAEHDACYRIGPKGEFGRAGAMEKVVSAFQRPTHCIEKPGLPPFTKSALRARYIRG